MGEILTSCTQAVAEHIEIAVTFLIAGLLTLFDLDADFYIPRATKERIRLSLTWWGFVVANGVLAVCLYLALQDQEPLKDWNRWARAAAIGLGYLALVRLKLTTIRDVPIGLETFYEKFKQYAYRRINRIALEARQAETTQMVSTNSLADLVQRAKLRIHNDALLSSEQKQRSLAWVLQVITDQKTDDFDKKTVIAIFILTGSIG